MADLCKALNIQNPTDVKKRLDKDDLDSIEVIDSMGRLQDANFVTEPGMYTVILRSDSPLAKPMQKWVTSEVLPAIRKTGGYMTEFYGYSYYRYPYKKIGKGCDFKSPPSNDWWLTTGKFCK